MLKSRRLGHQVVSNERVEGQAARQEPITHVVPEALQAMLNHLGIMALYRHQISALEAIRNGQHTVVSTPTASGKSLIYHLSVFEALLTDANAKALYLFPLKALTQDQLKSFHQWNDASPSINATAAVYDGDTSDYQRRKIRQLPPSVVMTNPDMLHLALMAFHPKWKDFFRSLKLVVIDEVHTYRGLLGSHMSQLLRRLRRICELYGSAPVFIFTSATVANPGELASNLCGLDVATIQLHKPAAGIRHHIIMNPDTGPSHTAIMLLKAALARKLRTIVYTQSRKLAELITLWVQNDAGKWAQQINVYRAGLLPRERRLIEQRLKKGELLAVVSTSALELGIDIGDLDICILVGYPGSMIATWQRSGRVGRQGQESALVLIAGNDALDRYFVHQPKAFFKGMPESAVVNPHNPVVMKSHLTCAAAENPLERREPWLQEDSVSHCVHDLEKSGQLLRTADGNHWHARLRRPQRHVDIRSAGERYLMMDGKTVVGELNAFRRYRDAHVGAIYLHQGNTYAVEHIDSTEKRIAVQPIGVDFYTRVKSDSDVNILEYQHGKYIGKTEIYYGIVQVIDQVTGYAKIHTANGRILEQVSLDVPPIRFTTEAVWFEIPPHICTLAQGKHMDLLGGLHAVEHATISVMPLVVLADRNDLGGLATSWHPQNGKASIFIYDAVPGGAGITRLAFADPMQLLKASYNAISRCDCDSGCPACVHSPKCGSGNEPMDKQGALFLLGTMIKPGKVHSKGTLKSREVADHAIKKPPLSTSPYFGVFDLETQRSAAEVGGWHMARRMKVSCGVVYDAKEERYFVYTEQRIDKLIHHLQQFDIVIGFNSKRFDYQVLSGYSDFDFSKLPSLDLLEVVHKQLGYRLSLDHLAAQTLQTQKSGSGLDALRWWQQGELEKIISYCRKDVQITKDLYCFAKEKGYLVYRHKDGGRFRVPMVDLHADASLV